MRISDWSSDVCSSDLLAVVERQHRHVALGIDRREVGAALGALLLAVDLIEIEGGAGLAQRDVGGERASAGHVVDLHQASPVVSADAPPQAGPGPHTRRNGNFCLPPDYTLTPNLLS